jgi:hypothetical protein
LTARVGVRFLLLCVALGVLRLSERFSSLSKLSIVPVKHALLILDRINGSVYLLDTSDLPRLLQQPLVLLAYTFPPQGDGQVDNVVLDMKEVRTSAGGNMLILNTVSRNETSNLILNETVTVLEYSPNQALVGSKADP